jgi:hypothetical protein
MKVRTWPIAKNTAAKKQREKFIPILKKALPG